MAIESVKCDIFTTKSDVWSFGVFMWEMYSMGEVPYPGMVINEAFIDSISNGYRMSKPDNCPQDVYENVILKCWALDPVQRPSFKDINLYISALVRTEQCQPSFLPVVTNDSYLTLETSF